MAEPRYDPSTQLVVAPDSEGRLTLELPDVPGLRSPGQYRVGLTYLVRDEAIGKSGTVLAKPMVWDEGTFTGRLDSNTIRLTVR